MKLAAKISSIILLLLLLLVPTIAVFSAQEYPEFTNEEPVITAVSSGQEYSEFIAGERVIYVQTSENTYLLHSNQVILTVLDDSNSMEESIAKFSDYLGNYRLPEGWLIEVIGGPGSSEEGYLQVHNSNNDAAKKGGPTKYGGPIQSFTSSEGSEAMTLGHYERVPTFAIDSTNDPGSETITYIDAEWIAPIVGTSQNHHSGLLVNGYTDTNYFMQAGQGYEQDGPRHIWCDDSHGLVGMDFGIPYVAGHRCFYFIAKFTQGWYMGMRDYTSGQFNMVYELSATGTKLKKDLATSVFFENWNSNSNWYSGFTNPISVYNAWNGIAVPANVHYWKGETITILDSHHQKQSNGIIFKKISGGLKKGGTANWNLQRLLLAEDIYVP